MSVTQFPIWKTITIGGKTKDQLIAEIKAKGFKIEKRAGVMMGKQSFTTGDLREVTLVRVTVMELGCKEGETNKDAWARAHDLGLRFCPAEVGPHLRLVEVDQPYMDSYWIGMEPIIGFHNYPDVFLVGHDVSGRWLSGRHPSSNGHAEPDCRIVFTAPSA